MTERYCQTGFDITVEPIDEGMPEDRIDIDTHWANVGTECLYQRACENGGYAWMGVMMFDAGDSLYYEVELLEDHVSMIDPAYVKPKPLNIKIETDRINKKIDDYYACHEYGRGRTGTAYDEYLGDVRVIPAMRRISPFAAHENLKDYCRQLEVFDLIISRSIDPKRQAKVEPYVQLGFPYMQTVLPMFDNLK
jgi:hypothetical protein